MLIEVIRGRAIPIGTYANVLEIYYYAIPNTNMKVKRCILEGYGSTNWTNVREVPDDETIYVNI